MQVPQTEITIRDGDGSILLQKTVPPGDYVLGREPSLALSIQAELVSRRHAQLTIEFDQVFIQDLSSSNGTSVNGQPITRITRLWPNQIIQVGRATVELRRLKTEPSSDASLAPAQAAVQRLLPEELLRDRKYAIGQVVAKGGMGAILDAHDGATDRSVAMKVMLDASSPDNLSRFIAEARVTAQLEHPNIVPVHELSVDENGQPFYTMKMVRGITLKKVLELLAQGTPETLKKYPLPALLTTFQKACDAVAFAHSKGIIHRDLKPENLMLGDFGEVLVMDWGLAKRMRDEGGRMKSSGPAAKGQESDPARSEASSSFILHPSSFPSATLAGTIMGTPQYMSPEQARGEVEDLDPRSDLYALGAILFHLLHLRAPYSGRTAAEVVDKVQRGEVEWTPPNSDLRTPISELPTSLLAVVRQALAFERDQRYQTVAELQADLTAYQTGFATSAENAGLGKQLLLALKRHKAVATSIAAALVILAAVVSAAFVRITSEKNRATRALSDLQRTAPTLSAEGRKLIDAQQFEDALAKISFAVTIEPKNAEYRLLRAQLLQAMLRLDEATAEFRRVLDLAPLATTKDSAQANLTLCEKLLHDYRSPEAFDRAAWQQLFTQMEKEGRATQAAPIAVKLGRARDASEALLKARLVEWRQIPGWEKKPETERVSWETDGSLHLHFNGGFLLDSLSSLVGLPITDLDISSTRVHDLQPLQGMHLRRLVLISLDKIQTFAPLKGMPLETFDADFAVDDLSPLKGMKLKDCALGGSKVRDLTALTGMPLKKLNVAVTAITTLKDIALAPITDLRLGGCRSLTDISAVRTMRLKNIILDGCSSLRDFTPLLDCPELEIIRLPRDCREVEVLRQHPHLRFLGYANERPAAEFWAEFDAIWKAQADDAAVKARLLAAFAAVGIPESGLTFVHPRNNGSYGLMFNFAIDRVKAIPDLHGIPLDELNLKNCSIGDLSPIAGLAVRKLGTPALVRDFAPIRKCQQLEELDLAGMSGSPSAKLRDLSFLSGLKLQALQINKTEVRDISVLAGMPLRNFRCDDTNVTDLHPLLSCPDLESLCLPEKATNVGELRALKKLQRLSYRWDGAFGGPAQSAEEFWKAYDAQHPAGSK